MLLRFFAGVRAALTHWRRLAAAGGCCVQYYTMNVGAMNGVYAHLCDVCSRV